MKLFASSPRTDCGEIVTRVGHSCTVCLVASCQVALFHHALHQHVISTGSSRWATPCRHTRDSRCSFSLDSSVSTTGVTAWLVGLLCLVGSSVLPCAQSACSLGSSFSLDSSLLMATVKALTGLITSNSKLSKMTLFPGIREGNVAQFQ